MLTHRSLRFAALATALAFTACGDDGPADPDDEDGVVLLSTTVDFEAGVDCNTGGATESFTSQIGKTIVVTANSSTTVLAPRFVLYAPDFSQQLAFSTLDSPGKASLTFTLTESGQHHLTFCETNGLGGRVTVKVIEQEDQN